MTDQPHEMHDSPAEYLGRPMYCPDCGAKQLGPATTCWLCHQALSAESRSLPILAEHSEPGPERFAFSLATLFLLITLASVCLGLIVVLPGLGILACIIMGPVFIRTLKVVRHRESVGQRVDPGKKVALFVGSFAVASVIAVVACVAAFGTFCSVCVSLIAMQGQGGQEAIPFFFLAILLTLLSIWGLVRLIRWSRRRYRHEMEKDGNSI